MNGQNKSRDGASHSTNHMEKDFLYLMKVGNLNCLKNYRNLLDFDRPRTKYDRNSNVFSLSIQGGGGPRYILLPTVLSPETGHAGAGGVPLTAHFTKPRLVRSRGVAYPHTAIPPIHGYVSLPWNSTRQAAKPWLCELGCKCMLKLGGHPPPRP